MRHCTTAPSSVDIFNCQARSTYPKRSAMRSTRAASMRSISERTWDMSAHSHDRFGSMFSALHPPFSRHSKATGRIFNHLSCPKQRLLVERFADELQTERRTLRRQSGRHRHAGKAGHVHRDGEDVFKIHRQWIAGFLTECKRG